MSLLCVDKTGVAEPPASRCNTQSVPTPTSRGNTPGEKEYLHHRAGREDLVGGTFPRLAEMGKLNCYRHNGNWIGVDTFKERQFVEDLYLNGNPFWAVWKRDGQPC